MVCVRVQFCVYQHTVFRLRNEVARAADDFRLAGGDV